MITIVQTHSLTGLSQRFSGLQIAHGWVLCQALLFLFQMDTLPGKFKVRRADGLKEWSKSGTTADWEKCASMASSSRGIA